MISLWVGALAIVLTGLLSAGIVLSLWLGDQLQAWADRRALRKEQR